MPPAGTRSGSSDEPVWVVPDSLRERLSERYGPVYSGPEVERRLRALTVFACCGDRVTETAIRIGHLPLVGVVDFKTQRNEAIDPSVFEPLRKIRTMKVRNPAGMLTGRLRAAVRALVDAGGGLLEVEGEEDLASLALVESLPVGATVIYGIPGAGASFVKVDPQAKERVRTLIGQMELRRLELGP
jgi:uncharacterized protein (UPF0218 family)